MYGEGHDEPAEQGALKKPAVKRKAPELDANAKEALASIDYKV